LKSDWFLRVKLYNIEDVIGEFKLNKPCYVGERVNQEYPISHRNEHLFNALKNHEQRLIQYNRVKEKEELQRFRSQLGEQINFNVQMLPKTSFITFPEFFTSDSALKKARNDKVKSEEEESEAEGAKKVVEEKNESDNFNKFPIQINFKNPVAQLNCQFLFVSSNKADIRVLKYTLTILPLPIKVAR